MLLLILLLLPPSLTHTSKQPHAQTQYPPAPQPSLPTTYLMAGRQARLTSPNLYSGAATGRVRG